MLTRSLAGSSSHDFTVESISFLGLRDLRETRIIEAPGVSLFSHACTLPLSLLGYIHYERGNMKQLLLAWFFIFLTFAVWIRW